jgi:hypothetical protein
MSEEVIEKPEDTPVTNEPAAMPASDDDGVQALIDEFEQANQQPEAAADISGHQETPNALDGLLADLDRSTAHEQKISELTGQVDSFRAAEFARQEAEAAQKWAGELQQVCAQWNPNIPDDFVKDRLVIAAAENPQLEHFWRYRGLTDAQLAIAKRDLQAAERLYDQALKAPDTDPRKQEALRFLEQRGQQLMTMLGARQAIRSVRNAILKKAEAVKPDYDPGVSADRELVAQAVRDGRGEVNPKPEQIHWGNLSASEGRRKVKEEFGFDPGWGV